MKNRNNLQIDIFVTPRFWIPSQNAKRQVLNPILGLQIYAEVDWLVVDPPLPDAGEPRVHAGQQQGQLQHQGEGGQQQGSLLRPRQG